MRKARLLASLLTLLAVLSPLAGLAQSIDPSENEDPVDAVTELSSNKKLAAASPPSQAGGSADHHRFAPQPVPPEPTKDHNANKTLSMGPFHISGSVQISTLRPISLDAGYNQEIGLKDVLYYALQNSLAIKISRESWNYQKFTLLGTIANALPIPQYGENYSETYSRILSSAKASAAVFAPTLFLPVFQGGNQVFSLWAQYYRDKGFRHSFDASVNDALMDVYEDYENLLLQYTLLRIREKSLEVSGAQLELNNVLYTAGTGTLFAIMQSRTQLASDRQAMQQQQVNLRQASLTLALALNLPVSINLMPEENTIAEQSMFDQSVPVLTLVDIAAVHRPELRQFEVFRLAARRNVQVATSPLFPSAGLFGFYTFAGTHASTIGPNADAISGAGVFPGLFDTYQGGYTVTPNIPYMGLPIAANIAAARSLARQALFQANQELQLVHDQVRSSYLNVLSARAQIDSSAYGVTSAREGLRLAQLRLRSGAGTNLEVITTQKNYIDALTSQAQAIISSNIAQAQLLHDVGLINPAALINGFKYTPDLLKPDRGRP